MRTENEVVFKAAERLLPYRKTWVDDHARWKFGLMARQVGKDFASGFKRVADCALAEADGRKIDWLISAPSELQSLEVLHKPTLSSRRFRPATRSRSSKELFEDLKPWSRGSCRLGNELEFYWIFWDGRPPLR